MDKTTFFSKIILNTLRQWQGTFSDDSIMRTILDNRFPLHDAANRVGWAAQLSGMEKAYREEHELSDMFPHYSKFLTREMIDEIVIRPMEELWPDLKEDFTPSVTTRTIGELLDLNDDEMKFLQFAVNISDMTYPFDAMASKIANYFTSKPLMISKLLNIPIKDAEKMINGFMIKSGIVIPSKYPEGYFTIAECYEELFNTPDITLDQIDTILFPKNISSDLTLDDYPHIENEISRVSDLIHDGQNNKIKGTNIMLWGPAGTGKTALALTLAQHHGWNLKLIGDISETDTEEKSRTDRLANLKIALKLFANDPKAVLLFDEIEDLFKTDNNATFSKAFINRIIETTPIPIIWTTNSLHIVGSPVLRRMSYNIHCKNPNKLARRRIWEKYANEYSFDIPDVKELDHYDISPALIKNASRLIGLQGDTRDISSIVSSLDTLVQYGYERKFDTQPKIVQQYDVGCVNADQDMGELTRRIVNTGVSAFALCLYGPPGTGKSEYARFLAKEMGRDVLFKRASDLVSPYVGMTEKNIAEAFSDAREESAMLIIDEGDSFFQNRETARQSWEISQVNEILSQMETHTEPFVITTNLMDNLDPASLRRFTFKVRFDYLKPDQARKIFRDYYGVDAPERMVRNDILTMGDIACVKKQVMVLGITSGEEIYRLIETECSLKPNFKKSMGF